MVKLGLRASFWPALILRAEALANKTQSIKPMI